MRTAIFAAVTLCLVLNISSCSVLQNNASAPPKKLIVWSPEDLTHDPIAGTTPEQHFITSLENRTLFGLDKDGKLTFDLADKYTISSDALTITVTLGKETFSDGTAITSNDVKATLSRLIVAGGDYGQLLDNVKGSGEAKSGSDFFGVTTPKPNTVIFALIKPDPFFVYHLAHPTTAILPAATIGAGGALTFGPHSGIYTAKTLSNTINATTVYQPRNKKDPVIDIVRKSADDLAKTPLVHSVDIVLGATTKSVAFKQLFVPQLAIASWNLYVKDGSSPLSDIRFRQAILMALDNKDSIAAYSTRAIAPKKFTGDTFDSVNCGTSCATNETKAKALIKEVYPTAQIPTITIDIENNEIQQALAASAAKKLLAIGVPTTVEAHNATDLSNVIARGQVELFSFGWVSEVAVGGDPLVNSFKADSTENVSGVTDATLETDIATYNAATSLEDKTADSKIIQERIKDLWLTRPMAHFQEIVTADKTLRHLNFDYYGRASIADIRTSN